MDPKLRVITELPIREIWNDSGTVSRQRLRWLSADDIKELL
jgi:hypothetical protein